MLLCVATAVGVFGVVKVMPKLAEPLSEGGVALGGGGVAPSAVRNARESSFEAASIG